MVGEDELGGGGQTHISHNRSLNGLHLLTHSVPTLSTLSTACPVSCSHTIHTVHTILTQVTACPASCLPAAPSRPRPAARPTPTSSACAATSTPNSSSNVWEAVEAAIMAEASAWVQRWRRREGGAVVDTHRRSSGRGPQRTSSGNRFAPPTHRSRSLAVGVTASALSPVLVGVTAAVTAWHLRGVVRPPLTGHHCCNQLPGVVATG